MQQAVDAMVIPLRQADADARSDLHGRVVRQREGLRQRVHDSASDRHRVRLRLIGTAGVAAEEERELVASEACDLPVGSQHGPEPMTHETEKLVADRVSVRVVDGLEAVEVDQQQA